MALDPMSNVICHGKDNAEYLALRLLIVGLAITWPFQANNTDIIKAIRGIQVKRLKNEAKAGPCGLDLREVV